MKFKMKMRGYDPAEVDKYIEQLQAGRDTGVAQKERIDQLLDENYALREQLKKYQDDEQAISKSLIISQRLAQEMKFDAEKYSTLVLSRAKIFYATWHAYAQTLISSLSQQEVAEFNKLQAKIEAIINAYEGKDVAEEVEELSVASTLVEQPVATSETSTPSGNATLTNPITKIEQAAEHTIDLRELARTDLSLEDLCAELGLTSKKY